MNKTQSGRLARLSDPDTACASLWRRIPGYTRLTFAAAVLLGMAVHLFMFTNKLPNHDDIGHLFGDTYGTASGRWLLPTVLQWDGNYSMPWLIGLISVLLLAVTACFTVTLLRIRRPVGCILTAAILVGFPAVTSTFAYMFTADAYFLSLALAAIAAYLTVRWKFGFLFGALGLALSMGIYQSYFGFAAALLVGALLFETLDGGTPIHGLLLRGLRYVGALTLGMLLYLAMVKLTTLKIGLVDYMGISEMGRISLSALPELVLRCYASIYKFFIWNDLNAHFSFLKYGFALMGLCAVALGVFLLRRRRLGAASVVLAVLLVVLFPLAANIIYVMVSGGKVHTLMIYGLSLLPILPVALAEYVQPELSVCAASLRRTGGIICCWVIVLSCLLTAYSYAVYDNKAYLKLDLSYEQAYAYSVRLVNAITTADGYHTGMPVVLVGSEGGTIYPDPTPQLDEVQLTGVFDMDGYCATYTYGYFLKYYLALPGQVSIGTSDLAQHFAALPEVVSMPFYPAAGSVRVIDGTAVVRLSRS